MKNKREALEIIGGAIVLIAGWFAIFMLIAGGF
jgi:hypothetical protein